MSKTGASPEFERKMQEIAAKTAHMVIPRSDIQRPITEPRYPAWTEDPEPTNRMIPAQAVEAAAEGLLLCRSVEAAGYDAFNSNTKTSVLAEVATERAAAERATQ